MKSANKLEPSTLTTTTKQESYVGYSVTDVTLGWDISKTTPTSFETQSSISNVKDSTEDEL